MAVTVFTGKVTDEQLAQFRSAIRGDVLADALTLGMYSTDASIFQITPTLVVCPRDADDVRQTLRLAGQFGLPLTPRGAGSGLAGESLTAGVSLDFSRYCTRIIDIDSAGRTATVEAGCVFQRLNDTLAAEGLLFGPDPSSGNRATIGGIVGNNSTGAHSIKYGHASDNLEALDVVLADGTAARFHTDGRVEGDGPSALREAIVQRVPALLAEWGERIDANWPKTDRNRAGYGVKDALRPDGTVNWAKMLCNSEGTLAVFTAAQLRLTTAPAVKALMQVNFESMPAMARALPALVGTGVSACELMDGMLLEMARQAHGGPHPRLPDVPAQLLIEHDGETPEQVTAKLDRTAAVAAELPGAIGRPERIIEPAEQAEMWDIRKNAVPLLFRGRNAPQPIPFIEDVAVPIEKMGQYIENLEALFAEEGVKVAHYAHAGHGEPHIRPFLDLHGQAAREQMVRIARRAFELAWACGGSISGEHGSGRVRTGWIAAQYGEVYELFKLVKQTFDPAGMLNPGNIITDRTPEEMMTTDLRFEHAVLPERLDTVLHWDEGELTGEVEACNGCGVCRGLEERLAMCPMFRAVGTEAASPRAKANLVRLMITGQLDERLRLDPSFRAVADLCVNCKSCLLECPSAVNIPKLMQEAKSYYVRHKGLRRVESVLSRGELMGLLGSRFGAVANLSLKIPGVRWVMEKLTGIDRRRPMPPFAFGSFTRKARKWVGRHNGEPVAKVAYFVDLFANYHDHALGRAVIDVLTHNGVELAIPPQKSAAMPPIDYGDLPAARKVIQRNCRGLLPMIERGYRIVCSEPTAALCLTAEWADVLHNDDTETLGRHTVELMSFLRDLHAAGKLKTDFRRLDLRVAYHAPCHLRALRVGTPGAELMRLIPGMQVDVIEKGCCGIAGTCGFQQRSYDTSLAAGRRMLDALRDGPAPYGASECSTCRMQMEHATGKYTFHPVKLLAMAYGYPVKGTPV